jgi:hypothetical protein
MAEGQWADPVWIHLLHKLNKAGPAGTQLSEKSHSFRLGEDRTLEVGVQLPGHAAAAWVVVVPDGKVQGTSTSWKQFCFVSLHAHAGAHFAPDKTLALLARACWWEKMRQDVLLWCDRCWQCLQFRRRPDRAPAGNHVSYTQRPWQDVMIDCEGPSSPADIATGAKYVLTYRCTMCGGVKLEQLEKLEHNHFRRAFLRCVFKTGTIPETIRTDRGPEVANAAMDELRSLLGSRRILGHAFRPTSQAPVERAHQETQRLLGITVHGVFKAFPGEWGELLPVVEFLLYNTPRGTQA